jgi:hypothetical protein
MPGKKKENPFKYSFKIVEMNILSFNETSLESNELNGLANEQINYNFGMSIGAKKEQDVFLFMFTIDFSCETKTQKKLYSITTNTTFSVTTDKKDLIQINDGGFTAPDSIMLTLVNISIGGTRGMVAAKLSTKEYTKLIMPIIRPKKIIEEMALLKTDAV